MALSIGRSVFCVLFPISKIISIFLDLSRKDENSASKVKESKTKPESAIQNSETIIACVILIIGIIAASLEYKKLAWLFITATVITFIYHIAGIYMSIGIIGRVVLSEKADRLSSQEHWAIETIAYVLFILDQSKMPNKAMNLVASLENAIVSDCLYITLYMLFLFLYIFLTCSSLPALLTVFSKLLTKTNILLRGKTKLFKVGRFFMKWNDSLVVKRPLVLKVIEATKSWYIIWRFAVFIILPITFVLDVSCILFKMLRLFLFKFIGLCFSLLKMVKQTIGRVVTWINNLSDRRLVAVSFRVALIVTLVATVIINRYTPIFREYEPSTEGLEFVASTILIPVIFEWISSMKRKKA